MDVEVAEAIHVGVFGGVGIGFELLVATAVGTEIVGPISGIRLRPGGSVEFIAPDELPGGLRGGRLGLNAGCGDNSREDDRNEGTHTDGPAYWLGAGTRNRPVAPLMVRTAST